MIINCNNNIEKKRLKVYKYVSSKKITSRMILK